LLEPAISGLVNSFENEGNFKSDSNGSLPGWFSKLMVRNGPDTVGVAMNRPGYLNLKPSDFFNQRAVIGGVAQIAEKAPDAINEVLAARLNEPPSPVDVMIYIGLNNGFAERAPYDGRTGTNDPDEDMVGSGAIKEMSVAKNPIFRMFAISNAERIRSSDRLKFYEHFVDEPDSSIKRTAIEAIAHLRSVGTREVLDRFRQAALRQGQAENAELAAREIGSLQSLH
jgi:hypothetical protein